MLKVLHGIVLFCFFSLLYWCSEVSGWLPAAQEPISSLKVGSGVWENVLNRSINEMQYSPIKTGPVSIRLGEQNLKYTVSKVKHHHQWYREAGQRTESPNYFACRLDFFFTPSFLNLSSCLNRLRGQRSGRPFLVGLTSPVLVPLPCHVFLHCFALTVCPVGSDGGSHAWNCWC